MTTFESLADELLLDLFEFFNAIDLFRSFHGLNSRFNNLLLHLFRSYRLNLQGISKHDFNTLCMKYLPKTVDQTIALRLSNDDDTPQQLEYFFLQDNFLHRCTGLRSFCLCNVLSEEIMETISFHLEHLPFLIRLDIIQCCIPTNPEDLLNFINRIWSLPKLLYCNLDIYIQDDMHFMAPTVTSSSLQCLSIKELQWDFNEINILLERTPSLQSLTINNYHIVDDFDIVINVASLITLNLTFLTTNDEAIINILRNMTNLYYLTIDIYGVVIDGYQWEQIIRNCTPKLRNFRLKEQITLFDQSQGDHRMDTLLESFKSAFWLRERQWFVRCDWKLTERFNAISLYTLPYPFAKLTMESLLVSRSTLSQDIGHQSYHRVQELDCTDFFLERTPSTDLYFPFVRYLTIELCIYDQVQSILPRLDRLTTLDISLFSNNSTLSQWSVLLNGTTSLHTLTINASLPSVIMPFIRHTNKSIRRLHFKVQEEWFDDEQCAILINAPLTTHCEILTIDVKNCNGVLDIVDKTINLRALKVRCEDDAWDFNSLLSGHDDFVQWLRKCLPKTCSITRNLHSLDYVHFWVR